MIIKMKSDISPLEDGFKAWCTKKVKGVKFFESKKFDFDGDIDIIGDSEELKFKDEIIKKYFEFQKNG